MDCSLSRILNEGNVASVITKDEGNTNSRHEPVTATDIASFAVWLIGILLLTAFPVGLGIFVTTRFPEIGTLNPGVKPWIIHLAVAIVVGWLVLSEVAELIVKMSIKNKYKKSQQILSTTLGFFILFGFFSIIFESLSGSLVAVVATHLCVLALLPVVKYVEKRQPDYTTKP